MKTIFLTVIGLMIFLSLSARAQVVKGVYNEYLSPVDTIAAQHANEYADVPYAGVNEDAKPQAQRYNEMVEPVDNAIVNHFGNIFAQ